MEILVCIKEVPDDSVEISYDAFSGSVQYRDAQQVVNAFDTYALEMAVRYKEEGGGRITVLTIGPERAKNALKDCLAVGADEAVRVADDRYQERDCKSIAQALASTVKALEKERDCPFDMIFCGKESTDFGSGQVGILLAEYLDAAVITNVVDLENREGMIAAKHEMEFGYDLIAADSPVVLTVEKPPYDPRYPTVKSKMAARKKAIVDRPMPDSPDPILKVLKVYGPPKRKGGVVIKEETAEEAVAKAVALMVDAKVL